MPLMERNVRPKRLKMDKIQMEYITKLDTSQSKASRYIVSIKVDITLNEVQMQFISDCLVIHYSVVNKSSGS